MPNSLTLLPTPRQIELREGSYAIKPGRRIALEGAPAQELRFTGERLRDAIAEHARAEWTLAATHLGPREEIGAVLQVDPARRENPETYELTIAPDGIQIVAPTPHGVFNAVATLIQLIQQSGKQLPALHIVDAPDFPNRGVMLDISRDKVPTMETLFDLVDLLASWKINQLQLYMEHTFSYRQHPEVWKDASPLTEQEILELDAYCRTRFVELVPNQNSFGHMHRWLRHARYRDLAERPEGFDIRSWWGTAPFSLNPLDPRSLDLVRSMYDELLPHFSSRQFNVGCDETFDLGTGRSQAEVERRGPGPVYFDFLSKIYQEVKARGRTMQFWGDIILNHPELVPQLPRDVIAMNWGYDAEHDFAHETAQFAQAKIPFYVCPGTSTWITLLGRTDNAIANIRNATENGRANGAIGVLNTDWGDWGHWQYLPISYLGFAYGAAMSWGVDSNRDLDLPRALDLFAFRDQSGVMGRLAYDLGNVYQTLGRNYPNASGLARNLLKSLEEIREFEDQDPHGYDRALQSIDMAIEPLRQAKMQRGDARLIRREFENAARLSRHGARRGLLAFEQSPRRAARLKRELGAELREILREHKKLWHARNRPGGFADSLSVIDKARQDYQV